MAEGDKYKVHKIYGSIQNMPLGHLYDENLPKYTDPVDFANVSLEKRLMHGEMSIEKELTETDLKLGDSTIHFLYEKNTWVESKNFGGTLGIIFYPEAMNSGKGKAKKGIGFAFEDLEVAEKTLIEMVRIIQAFKDK